LLLSAASCGARGSQCAAAESQAPQSAVHSLRAVVMSEAILSGHLSGGWGNFYQSSQDAGAGQPHLRTYQGPQAEKFYETFAQPHAPPRPGKPPPPHRPESLTWGMGGTQPCGRLQLHPKPTADFVYSQKRYLVPGESGELLHGMDMGRKGQVYNDSGLNLKARMSNGFVLEDVMQRKQRVPEEVRSEARTIHRMAPPGLKGYMGAEYSNDFFTYYYAKDKASEGDRAATSGLGGKTRKSFAQKRTEEEVAEQVALVARLHQPIEAGGDDSDDEEVVEKDKVPVES